ncbi:unnamed protein product [Gongylonema pulchrum]|uniref:39S ribosomal protein L22, mitochondrial n=1 Tax=Gongylonema pulchrum TaxID=637853 RepID=A0A183DAC6_9BILA|nr:unnamed protein product [Gongylonema pulchrum]
MYSLFFREKRKTVLVHRRFEIARNVSSLPRNKKELERLYTAKLAFQFHLHIYPKGHYIPHIEKWFREPENFTTATVAEEHEYLNADWEPQFVADESVPLHDERFPLRMRSNTHLGSLLCRKGYTFTVVNDLFSVHWDIKRKEPKENVYLKRAAVRNGYRQTVKSFRAMLDMLYPETKDKCPFPKLN